MTALIERPAAQTHIPSNNTGNYFMEVLLPVDSSALPAISGWTLKLWPAATFGDATLQAVGQGSVSELTAALHHRGIEALTVVAHR